MLLMGLNLPPHPVSPFHVEPTEDEDKAGVDNLRGPAECHVYFQVKDDISNVGGINHQCTHFQSQSGTCVSGTGDRLKVNIGGYQKQVGGTHHPKRMDGGFPQVGHIRVDAQYRLGEQHEKQRQRQHEQVSDAHVLVDGARHAVGVSRTNQVADQRTAGGGECHHHHEQDAGHVADDVCHGKRPFTQMFHVEEEQEPGAQ